MGFSSLWQVASLVCAVRAQLPDPFGRSWGSATPGIGATATWIRTAALPSEIIDSCYYRNYQYSPYLPGTTFAAVEDHVACQLTCQNITNCKFFSFWPASKLCWLSGSNAVFEPAIGAVTGPQACPKVAAGCTELPGVAFPGATERDSKMAWPSHRVPEPMECWPTNWEGGLYDSCPRVKVLEDMETGWPGKCEGLKEVVVPLNLTCESHCRKDVHCSVFQLVQLSPLDPITCWHATGASGTNCYMRERDAKFVPLSAKRLQHGKVRVLKDLSGVQILGLMKAFDQNYFVDVATDAVQACRSVCYSNLLCGYWQYFQKTGCWVEDPATALRPMESPLTQASWVESTDLIKQAIAGEYIQHICPLQQASWVLAAANTGCGDSGVRDLSNADGTLVSLAQCEDRTSADLLCGAQMYSNGGSTCGCMRLGWTCGRQPSTGGVSLYEFRVTYDEAAVYDESLRRSEDAPGRPAAPPNQDAAQAMLPGTSEALHQDLSASLQVDPDALLRRPAAVSGLLTVANLRFAALTAVQKVQLSALYAQELARANFMERTAVQDAAGVPGSVTIEASTASAGGTQVRFLLMPNPLWTLGNVTAALEAPSFLKQLEADAATISPNAVEGATTIRVILAPAAVPEPWARNADGGATVLPSSSNEQEEDELAHLRWWLWLLVGLGIAGCALGTVLVCIAEGPRKIRVKRNITLMDDLMGQGEPLSAAAHLASREGPSFKDASAVDGARRLSAVGSSDASSSEEEEARWAAWGILGPYLGGSARRQVSEGSSWADAEAAELPRSASPPQVQVTAPSIRTVHVSPGSAPEARAVPSTWTSSPPVSVHVPVGQVSVNGVQVSGHAATGAVWQAYAPSSAGPGQSPYGLHGQGSARQVPASHGAQR